MASLVIGPTNRNPDYFNGEYQYADIIDAQTAVLVSAGGGVVHTVEIGVVGTLAVFYDTPSGGTTDATTQIAKVSLAALSSQPIILDVAFSKGLTVVVTGASTELTVSFRGAQTVSSRTIPPAGRGGAWAY